MLNAIPSTHSTIPLNCSVMVFSNASRTCITIMGLNSVTNTTWLLSFGEMFTSSEILTATCSMTWKCFTVHDSLPVMALGMSRTFISTWTPLAGSWSARTLATVKVEREKEEHVDPQQRDILRGVVCWSTSCSWPGSPPHWLSQKRNKAHVKALRPSYFINSLSLYWQGGLTANVVVWADGFSRVLVSFVFDSWWMYIFCGALTSLFYVSLVNFYFPLVFYFSLCSS